jgi:hypothetical protein
MPTLRRQLLDRWDVLIVNYNCFTAEDAEGTEGAQRNCNCNCLFFWHDRLSRPMKNRGFAVPLRTFAVPSASSALGQLQFASTAVRQLSCVKLR